MYDIKNGPLASFAWLFYIETVFQKYEHSDFWKKLWLLINQAKVQGGLFFHHTYDVTLRVHSAVSYSFIEYTQKVQNSWDISRVGL